MLTTRVQPQPLFRVPFPYTRNLLFAPDGQIVIGLPDDSWISMSARGDGMRVLPTNGSHAAFLGRWLLVGGGDGTQALKWGAVDRAQNCELGFDHDAALKIGQAMVAGAPTRSSLVRRGQLWSREGDPDTIDDRRGWVHLGVFSANIRLLCSSDGRYIVGCNAGAQLDVFDTVSNERRMVDLECAGHPFWMSLHPTEPVAAVGSGALEFVDLKRGVSEKRMELRKKILGDYLPNGTLLCSSEFGVLAVRNDDVRVVLDESTAEYQPVRVSPDGQVVLVAGEHLSAYLARDFCAP